MRASRLQRSVLAVPATSERFAASAARSAADAIFLDLEDAVLPARKAEARASAIHSLNHIDWGNRVVSVRINEIGSAWGYRDIVEIVEQCPRLDTILVPKVAQAEEIRFVARLLEGIELGLGRETRVGIEALIETPRGVARVEQIAAASSRLESLAFGTGDYSVAMHVPQTQYGSPDPHHGVLGRLPDGSGAAFYWNDQWHFALARIANACRANGLRPLDGPFTAIDSPAGYFASARRSRALGFEGKWAIHPSQIEMANESFTPTRAELSWALRVRDAMTVAASSGYGATTLDGAMVDLAHLRHAQIIQSRQQLIDSQCPRGALAGARTEEERVP